VERERAKRERAERERELAERAETERVAQERAERERARIEQAARERAERERAELEHAKERAKEITARARKKFIVRWSLEILVFLGVLGIYLLLREELKLGNTWTTVTAGVYIVGRQVMLSFIGRDKDRSDHGASS